MYTGPDLPCSSFYFSYFFLSFCLILYRRVCWLPVSFYCASVLTCNIDKKCFIHLSVMLQCCIEMAYHTVILARACGSPIIIVFPLLDILQNDGVYKFRDFATQLHQHSQAASLALAIV